MVFQSATPKTLAMSSRLSLWLMATDLAARVSRRVCAIAFASWKSRMRISFAKSEPGVSGGCVADPVARGKGNAKGTDTFTVPEGRNRQVVLTYGDARSSRHPESM